MNLIFVFAPIQPNIVFFHAKMRCRKKNVKRQNRGVWTIMKINLHTSLIFYTNRISIYLSVYLFFVYSCLTTI